MRNPDAVIGTAVSNWIMQAPIALTALTGSLTEVAFHPTFLDTFNPVVERVSTALHDNLFASWIPVVLTLLGGSIIFTGTAQRVRLDGCGRGLGAAGDHRRDRAVPVADRGGQRRRRTVTATIGEAVGRLDGDATGTDPGVAVASQVHEAILYRSWLAGTLGSPDSAAAKKYGADLFKAQALTWREARGCAARTRRLARRSSRRSSSSGPTVADKIREADPEAYENLTGERSETRVGYAVLAAIGTFLSLPFLLLSALLMLGCFFIVRLAVMLFPAFAVLGRVPGLARSGHRPGAHGRGGGRERDHLRHRSWRHHRRARDPLPSRRGSPRHG